MNESKSTRRRARLASCAAGLAAALACAAPASAGPPFPNNLEPPRIEGGEPRQQGQILTAHRGRWETAPDPVETGFTYRWFRCDGGGCAPAGEPSASSSYTLRAADVGRRMMVRVTGSCDAPGACHAGGASADSGQTGAVLPDPRNEALPQISGLAQVGQTLSASVGFWRSVAPLSFSHQWMRCDAAGDGCQPIEGAAGAEYALGDPDAGRTLRVAVVGRNAARQATAVSAPTPTVTALPPPTRRRSRLLSPFPRVVIAGVLRGSRVALSEFSIRAPRGSLVRIRCRGRGCPFRSRRFRIRRSRTRVRSLQRRLRPGTRIEVRITKRGFVGKYTRIRIRRGRVPARKDLCLRPGARTPTRCPRR